MPETVIAWKVVALVASGRKSTQRILRDIVHELRSIVPSVRIDTEIFSLTSIDGKFDAAFEKALVADIIISVVDEAFGGVVISPRTVSEDFMAGAAKLISFMSNYQVASRALFIRFRPEAPNGVFRSRIKGLLGSNASVYKMVESNEAFEAEIRRMFWERLAPLQEISKLTLPPQGAGPRFGMSMAGQIASIPTIGIDQSGNDLHRVGQLLPLIRECVDDFLASSGSLGNQHPTLMRDVSRYRQLISNNVEAIPWGTLWGVGVKLEKSAVAAERKVADRLAPELEDEPLTALQSLRSLHAALILATAEGRELQEQADRMRMTRDEQATLRGAAVALSEGLKQNEKIIEPEAASIVAEAAEMVGAEPHPERGTTYGLAIVKNMAIVLFGAALATAPKFLLRNYLGDAGTVNYLGDAGTMSAWEALKKWPAFAEAAEALGKDFQTLVAEEKAVIQVAMEQLMPFRAFIALHEQHLRVIAGATPQLRWWLLPYINYIIRTS